MEQVFLYIYDLSQGLLAQLAPGLPLRAILHTSLVVFGREYYYGGGDPGDFSSGICVARTPGLTEYGAPVERRLLGTTGVARATWTRKLAELGRTQFTRARYRVLDNNCNTFTSVGSLFLLGRDIPREIKCQHEALAGTPLGRVVLPLLERLDRAQGALRAPQLPPSVPEVAGPERPGRGGLAGVPLARLSLATPEAVRAAFPRLLSDSPVVATAQSLLKPRALGLLAQAAVRVLGREGAPDDIAGIVSDTLVPLVAARAFSRLGERHRARLVALRDLVVGGLAALPLGECVVLLDVARLLALFTAPEFDFFRLPGSVGGEGGEGVPLAATLLRLLGEGVFARVEAGGAAPAEGEGEGAALWRRVRRDVDAWRGWWRLGGAQGGGGGEAEGEAGRTLPGLAVPTAGARAALLLLAGRLLCNSVAGHGVGGVDLRALALALAALAGEGEGGLGGVVADTLVNVAVCVAPGALAPDARGFDPLLALGGLLAGNVRAGRLVPASARALGRLLIAGQGLASHARLLALTRLALGVAPAAGPLAEARAVEAAGDEEEKELLLLLYRM